MFAGAVLWHLWYRTQFWIFQARDLDRAMGLLRGTIPWFGPELSGGGHVPGGFYYWLLALPLSISSDWRGTWAWMVVLAALAMGLMGAFLWRRLGPFPAVVAVFLLFTTPHYAYGLALFQNPSFLPLFAVAAMTAFSQAIAGEAYRERWWLLGCGILGLGVQIHASILAIFPAAIYFWLRSSAPRRPAFLVAGLGIFLIPLLPFYAWRVAGALGHAYGLPAWPSLAGGEEWPWKYLGRMLALRWTPWQSTEADRIEFLPVSWPMFVPPGALGALALGIRFRRPASRAENFSSRALRFWVLCAAFAAIPAYPAALAGKSLSRYDLLFLLVLPFPLAGALHHWLADRKPRDWALVCTGMIATWVLFLVGLEFTYQNPMVYPWTWLALAAALPLLARWRGGEKFALHLSAFGAAAGVWLSQKQFEDSRAHLMPTVRDFADLATEVKKQTGWTFAEARSRLFFVNVNRETTPEYVFRSIPNVPHHPPVPLPPTGFIYAWEPTFRFKRQSVLDWLQEEKLNPDILDAIREGTIRLGKATPTRIGYLVPYYSRADGYPSGFQNLGAPYDVASIPTLRPAPNVALFKDCPGQDELCTIAITAAMNPGNRLRFRIDGFTLSQPTPWTSYEWVERLNGVYADIRCSGNTVPKRVSLASRIGIAPKTLDRVLNGDILAPLERTIPNPCAVPPAAIRVGYESARAVSRAQVVELPGKSGDLALARVTDFRPATPAGSPAP